MKVRPEVLQSVGGRRNSVSIENIFKPAVPPPGVVPKDEKTMAMDDASMVGWSGWAGGLLANIVENGLTFLGYPYLSELAQRPEYRVISEVIATEMTRKWIKFKAKGDEDSKAERIKQLEDEFERLEVRDRFCCLAEQDGFFGRSHLYIDVGEGTEDDAELIFPIGDGREETSRTKVQKGALRRLKVIEPVWTYPQTYNATNPLSPDWYNPQVWFVMGKRIHGTRLLTFVGRPVPDMLKPAYSFGGLSRSQMAKPYVDNWLRTRQSVADIIHAFSVMVLQTDLQTYLQAGGMELMNRIALFNATRDNKGLMVTDKTAEDFKNVSAPLSGLDELQAQTQEHMSAVSRIPLVKLLGISPHGLNASSEGEIRVFYDTIHSEQQRFFGPHLNRVMNFAMLNLWGEVDPDIVFEFEPLWEIDEKAKAELRKTEAETGNILIDNGSLHPGEERKRLANDPDTPYDGIDVNDLPDLLEEEADGLEPQGGKPQPVAQGEAEVEEGTDLAGDA